MNRSLTAICVLLGSFCVTAATASPVECARNVTAAMKLTVEEARALEERLATDANDQGVRSQLVIYHHRDRFGDPGSRAAHTAHVLWLIRNAPEAGILGTPHSQIDAYSVANAKHHLLAAARSGAPTLGSFGPNMSLARDLLERGEREVVLEYFELCARFWPSDKLRDWAALVEGGRTPDFGANLVY